MKKIILVRHGKSSWEYDVTDKDRSLLQRGITDGHLVTASLKEQKVEVDAIFSSPANRALHTAMIFMRELNYSFSDFQITNELYDFSGTGVRSFINGLHNDYDSVLIFGHNHAFTHIANTLGSTYIENVPTTGLVVLEFNSSDWSSIEKGTTVRTIFPKELK